MEIVTLIITAGSNVDRSVGADGWGGIGYSIIRCAVPFERPIRVDCIEVLVHAAHVDGSVRADGG
ncbi:hypothetical protein DSECCO2_449570 [anaerobic digester metagenome]